MSAPTQLPTDNVHRRLVHRLFDAIEAGDLVAVADCYAPDMTMWFNVTGQVTTGPESLEALANGYEIQRRRTYDDRLIDTWDDGFLARYTLNVVLLDGSTATLWACLVGEVHDGRIVRMWEYLDSSKFTPRRPRRRVEAGASA